jgi:PAS domain S-box-containing protein
MAAHAEQSLPLILAREFASNIATPLAVIDATGRLIYFNEPAERIIGSTPAELGELTEEEWRARFSAEHPDGSPAGIDEMATVIARRERRPAHERLVITTLDGLRRPLAVTAIPLLEGEREDLVGCVVLFWEE